MFRGHYQLKLDGSHSYRPNSDQKCRKEGKESVIITVEKTTESDKKYIESQNAEEQEALLTYCHWNTDT